MGRHDGYNLSMPFYRLKQRIGVGTAPEQTSLMQMPRPNAKTPPFGVGFLFEA
jgi:hypothetical protein